MEILIILFLILLNGVFSMSEIALISARKNRLETAAKKGKQMPTLINVCTGEIAENIQNIAEFSRQHGLTQSAIGAVILGKRATHKGWTIA